MFAEVKSLKFITLGSFWHFVADKRICTLIASAVYVC
jgi:hypothetical protein